MGADETTRRLLEVLQIFLDAGERIIDSSPMYGRAKAVTKLWDEGLARDPSYDGRFFTGVRTTRVYCRPVCPGRKPLSTNVCFFPSAAAAELAGFRPCLLYRPETAPFCPAWKGTRATVDSAVRLIVEEGALDSEGASVDIFAEKLGLGARQLSRLFSRHLNATPIQVARTARVQRAKRLLDFTDLPMTEVAMRAGFRSLRRFNIVFVEV